MPSGVYVRTEKIKAGLTGHPNYFTQGHTQETKNKIRNSKLGKARTFTVEWKQNLSKATKGKPFSKEHKQKLAESICKTKWIKVRTDLGQLAFLNKWNNLGFNFEPNYQLKTISGLYYLDGYDKLKNVIVEYDSKYHNKPSQKQADLTRQNNIIDAIKPRVFWRYNNSTKQCVAVYRST
jgi:hypothetical protein